MGDLNNGILDCLDIHIWHVPNAIGLHSNVIPRTFYRSYTHSTFYLR